MWKILQTYDIPRKFVSIIQSMYDGSESCVRVGQDHTDWFSVATRVRQGDVLSPLLFNILLDTTSWTQSNSVLNGLVEKDCEIWTT